MTSTCPDETVADGQCTRAAGWGTTHPDHGYCVHHDGAAPPIGSAMHRDLSRQGRYLLVALLALLDDCSDGIATTAAQSFLRALPGVSTDAVLTLWDAAKSGRVPGIVCRPARADQRPDGLWRFYSAEHAATAPTGGGTSPLDALHETLQAVQGRR